MPGTRAAYGNGGKGHPRPARQLAGELARIPGEMGSLEPGPGLRLRRPNPGSIGPASARTCRVFPALPVVSDGLLCEERPFKLIMHPGMDALNADIRVNVGEPR